MFLFCSMTGFFAWCVRLSWLLVGFWTHLKSMHFHLSISKSAEQASWVNFITVEDILNDKGFIVTRKTLISENFWLFHLWPPYGNITRLNTLSSCRVAFILTFHLLFICQCLKRVCQAYFCTDLIFARIKICWGKNTGSGWMADAWNSQLNWKPPQHLRSADTSEQFKCRLKGWPFECVYGKRCVWYTLTEGVPY